MPTLHSNVHQRCGIQLESALSHCARSVPALGTQPEGGGAVRAEPDTVGSQSEPVASAVGLVCPWEEGSMLGMIECTWSDAM